jgi:hypothetical protein
MPRNFARFRLFLYGFVDVRRGRVGHLHRAAADERTAAGAGT